MTKKPLIEVCAFHIESCIIAARLGAGRIELCDNPVEGGTTPSYGTIKIVRQKVDLPLYPIIRPRPGNYFYTTDELAIMKEDIRMCRKMGCNGISVGIQRINGEIDTERLRQIVQWAGPMGVTCNRVFDNTPNPFSALEDIINCGCKRILTSGQKSRAPEGIALLTKLVQQAGDRIIIMPGAGVNSANIRQLRQESGAIEFHSSARKNATNQVTFINKEVSDYGNVYIADENELKAMLAQLE